MVSGPAEGGRAVEQIYGKTQIRNKKEESEVRHAQLKPSSLLVRVGGSDLFLRAQVFPPPTLLTDPSGQNI